MPLTVHGRRRSARAVRRAASECPGTELAITAPVPVPEPGGICYEQGAAADARATAVGVGAGENPSAGTGFVERGRAGGPRLRGSAQKGYYQCCFHSVLNFESLTARRTPVPVKLMVLAGVELSEMSAAVSPFASPIVKRRLVLVGAWSVAAV